MCIQSRILCKAFSTFFAFVWLFTSVYSFMRPTSVTIEEDSLTGGEAGATNHTSKQRDNI